MNYKVAKGSSYPDGEMKESAPAIPCSKECKVRSRMNLQFSLSKTLTVERLEILDEEATVFSSKSYIEEDEEEEEDDDSCVEGSRFL